MDSSLPADPYAALGVSKNADAATIKSTYRKLALKCHPDKVTDESQKQQKREEFHRIQQAYELIGDEDKRTAYDAAVRLNEFRKEKLARAGSGGPSVDIKTAHYDLRTAAPAGASFAARGPARYEERKPSRSYDDDRHHEDRSSSRKYDTYDAYPKRSSPRSSREKEPPIRASRTSTDRTRSDHKKTRDREERRDRSGKFVYVEDDTPSSADEKTRYEAEYKRRAEEDQARREAAEARRKAEDRRSHEEPRRHRSDDRETYDRQRKINELQNDAFQYISRAKAEAEIRPSPGRNVSSRDVRPEHYDSRSRRDRPETVRRSSARPKDSSQPASSGRDSHRDRKGIPEIVEWGDDDRKVPSFKHSNSSPADLHVPPRATPQRSYTETSTREHRRTDSSPTPAFRRSETMPTASRRKEATSRSTGLRSSETVVPMPTTETFPTVPPPLSSSTRKLYHYPMSGGVRIAPEEPGVANGHRTVLHEPARHRTRSPSPLSRPPMGPNRLVETSSIPYQPAAPAPPRTTPITVPPPLARAATMNVSPVRGEERGRSRQLFGEIRGRQASFSPEKISYAKKFGPDDIRWSAPRGRDPVRDREYMGTKPSLGRHATSVY